MKRLIFLIFTICSPFSLSAQVSDILTNARVGIKFSPMFTYSRVDSDDSNLDASGKGIGFRAVFGPFIDVNLQDNYYFSTGLLYAPKRAGLEVEDEIENVKRDEIYSVQYLQVPLSLKLLTNEVDLDMKLYFQLGGILELKINEKPEVESNILVEDFRLFDISWLLGAGLEYELSQGFVLVGGLSYNRGLINAASDTSKDFSLRNDLILIDLGIKF